MTGRDGPPRADVLSSHGDPDRGGRRASRRRDAVPADAPPADDADPAGDTDREGRPPAPPSHARRLALGIGLAALALGGTVVAARGVPDAPTPDASASSAPVFPAPSATPPVPFPRSAAVDVRFADADHGFAVTGRCTAAGRDPARRCAYGFRVTADGGRTWATRPAPLPDKAEDDWDALITALGPRAVVVATRSGRWHTRDAGRTWRQVPSTPGAPVARAAPTWTLDTYCDEDPTTGGCRRSSLVALDPETGVPHPLVTQPRLDPASTVTDPPPRATDGSRWIGGTERGTGRPAVAVSRDQGRTWTTRVLDAPATQLFGVTVLTVDGTTGYALLRAQPETGTDSVDGFGALHRTTDSGRTWQRIAPAFRGAQPATATGAALLPSGRIVLTADDGGGPSNQLVSDDRGASFRSVASDVARLGLLDVSSGRCLSRGTDGWYVSPDCRTWTRLQLRGL